MTKDQEEGYELGNKDTIQRGQKTQKRYLNSTDMRRQGLKRGTRVQMREQD